MDDNEKVEQQVEDLEMEEEDAEDVKGGKHGGITADDDWETPNAVQGKAGRGGWDGNHNETLVVI